MLEDSVADAEQGASGTAQDKQCQVFQKARVAHGANRVRETLRHDPSALLKEGLATMAQYLADRGHKDVSSDRLPAVVMSCFIKAGGTSSTEAWAPSRQCGLVHRTATSKTQETRKLERASWCLRGS